MVMEILKHLSTKLIFALLLSLLLFSGCRKEATVKIPETEPKPVLVCFISPEDSLIRVKLTNSITLYTDNSKKYPYYITNAEVTLSHGSFSKNIPLIQDTLGYQLHTSLFPIKPGETYTLTVKIPDGRTLTATTTVPKEDFPMLNFSIEKKLLDSNEYAITYEYNYTMSWNDIPSSANYYRSVIYSLYTDSALSGDTTAQQINEAFDSDAGKDGSVFKIAGTGNVYYFQGSPGPISGSNYIAYLMLCNKEYFEYHKDLYTFSDINPFSESRINYSNIEGGIGCFSAYRLSKKRF